MKKITFLNQIVQDILRESEINSLLEIAVDRLTHILSAERATFYFFNRETDELWSYVAKDLEISEIRVPLGKGIAGQAAATKKVLNIKDAYRCRYFNKKVDQETGYRTRTVLSAPLMDSNEQLIGAIQVLNKKRGYFSRDDEDIFRSICLSMAIALENIRLLQEKETLLRSALYALAGAIDAKDPATAGHSHRVAYYAVKIAWELGCSEEEVKSIEYAAYLHDVGKIGIPDRVLHKRKKLTTREKKLMEKHPLYTLQILKSMTFSQENKKIPLIASYHHELLDGSGYPFGLREEQIDVFSRIITVADIYDALVSFDRPYKKGYAIEGALRILKKEAEQKHLDRKIVATFVNKELYRHERRRYERIDLHIAISYQIIPQRRILREHIRDEKKVTAYDLDVLGYQRRESLNISRGGALFLTRQYLPVGSYLDLEIEFPSRTMKCISKIVWTEKVVGTPHYRVGTSFINMSPRMTRVLDDELRKQARRKK